MNKTRILILAVLVLCLLGLGSLFVWNSIRLQEVQAQQEEAKQLETIEQKQAEVEKLRNQHRSPLERESGSFQQGRSNAVPGTSTNSGAQETDQDKIKALEAEIERLKNQKDLAEEEKAVIESHEAGQKNPKLKEVNQVMDARLVGKVEFYDREQNLLVFKPIGQPGLKNDQELAIRRRGAIFVTIVLDELDSESGAWTAEVKRNDLYDKNTQTSVEVGDEIIIPPPTFQTELPELKMNPLNTNLPPIPMEPDYTVDPLKETH